MLCCHALFYKAASMMDPVVVADDPGSGSASSSSAFTMFGGARGGMLVGLGGGGGGGGGGDDGDDGDERRWKGKLDVKYDGADSDTDEECQGIYFGDKRFQWDLSLKKSCVRIQDLHLTSFCRRQGAGGGRG